MGELGLRYHPPSRSIRSRLKHPHVAVVGTQPTETMFYNALVDFDVR